MLSLLDKPGCEVRPTTRASFGVPLIHDPLPFLKTVHQLFHVEMGFKTSGCLFGSAATGNWVAGRSDLDLLIHVPEEQIDLFSSKIKEWQTEKTNPPLGGYAIFNTANTTMARALDDFDKRARPAASSIDLIDLWKVKNESRHLFGNDITSFVRAIDRVELQNWAMKHIQSFWIPIIDAGISFGDVSSEQKVSHSKVVWTATGVARILMLAEGTICNSKREALHWLQNRCVEIKPTLTILADNFDSPDDLVPGFSSIETRALGISYLRLLREVKQP